MLIGWIGFSLKTLLPYFFLLLPRRSWKNKIKWAAIFFVTVGAMQAVLHGIIFNVIVVLMIFSVIFILPFKNAWKLE